MGEVDIMGLGCCRVERAFPVQEVQSEADTPGVAMDPKDEARVRESMQSQHHLRWGREH